MFTPPPSPAPLRGRRESLDAPSSSSSTPSSMLSPCSGSSRSTPPSSPSRSPSPCPLPARLHQKQPSRTEQHRASTAAKKRVGLRTRWIILLVPAALVLIALSTRYIVHPAALDALAPGQPDRDWREWAATLSTWQPHKRHPSPDPDPQGSGETISIPSILPSSTLAAASSVSSASVVPTSAAAAATPTVPAESPALPSPFPQPLDTTLSQNFSTERCQNFLINMTQSLSFRECRPFGMLLQSSSAFANDQTNLTLTNDIVWGTCNTDLSEDQCLENMGYFYESMQTACSVELGQQNEVTTSTLLGLETYLLMRQTGCLIDSTTNTYCYIQALSGGSASLADQELYWLPLGTPLPNNSVLSCSECSQRVLMGYVNWVGNITGFTQTYEDAANIANRECGAGYVSEVGTASASRNGAEERAKVKWAAMLGVLAVVAAAVS